MFDNDGILGLQEVIWIVVSSFVWIGYLVVFVGLFLFGILIGFGLLKVVLVGIRYVFNVLFEVDVIIKYFFDICVKLMDKELLKILFIQYYDNFLWKFYCDILKEYLFVVDKSLFFVLEEMGKDVDRFDEEYNINKEMLLKMC